MLWELHPNSSYGWEGPAVQASELPRQLPSLGFLFSSAPARQWVQLTPAEVMLVPKNLGWAQTAVLGSPVSPYPRQFMGFASQAGSYKPPLTSTLFFFQAPIPEIKSPSMLKSMVHLSTQLPDKLRWEE